MSLTFNINVWGDNRKSRKGYHPYKIQETSQNNLIKSYTVFRDHDYDTCLSLIIFKNDIMYYESAIKSIGEDSVIDSTIMLHKSMDDLFEYASLWGHHKEHRYTKGFEQIC